MKDIRTWRRVAQASRFNWNTLQITWLGLVSNKRPRNTSVCMTLSRRELAHRCSPVDISSRGLKTRVLQLSFKHLSTKVLRRRFLFQLCWKSDTKFRTTQSRNACGAIKMVGRRWANTRWCWPSEAKGHTWSSRWLAFHCCHFSALSPKIKSPCPVNSKMVACRVAGRVWGTCAWPLRCCTSSCLLKFIGHGGSFCL